MVVRIQTEAESVFNCLCEIDGAESGVFSFHVFSRVACYSQPKINNEKMRQGEQLINR